MSENLYAPPEAEVRDFSVTEDGEAPGWHSMPTWKLVFLYSISWSLYGFWWFYKHWATQRQRTGEPFSPLARGIFNWLYVVQMFRLISADARREGEPERNLGYLGVVYILMSLTVGISSNVAERIGEYSFEAAMLSTVFAIALVIGIGVLLGTVQRRANIAANDATGSRHAGLSWKDWILIVIGGIYWLMVGAGIAAYLFLI